MRSGLLLVALVSMLGMPFQVLMPVMASEVLGGGAHTLGMLMTSTGLGALRGHAVSRVAADGRRPRPAASPQASTCFGIGAGRLLAVAQPVAVAARAADLGAGFMISLAATNTIVQTIVPEDLRGRVMAFYAMSFLGTAPIGSLIAGTVAERIGAPATIMAGGICCIASGVWFFSNLPHMRAVVRPIYIQKGLLVVPDADTGAKTL